MFVELWTFIPCVISVLSRTFWLIIFFFIKYKSFWKLYLVQKDFSDVCLQRWNCSNVKCRFSFYMNSIIEVQPASHWSVELKYVRRSHLTAYVAGKESLKRRKRDIGINNIWPLFTWQICHRYLGILYTWPHKYKNRFSLLFILYLLF